MYSRKNKILLEILIIFVIAIAVFIFSARHDILEGMLNFSRAHESWEMDEAVTVAIYLILGLSLFSLRRWHESVTAQKTLQLQNTKLHEAYSEIKELRGILPICAECKNIRDDKGYWHKVEEYIRDNSNFEFTHGLCPDCSMKLYPEFASKND